MLITEDKIQLKNNFYMNYTLYIYTDEEQLYHGYVDSLTKKLNDPIYRNCFYNNLRQAKGKNLTAEHSIFDQYDRYNNAEELIATLECLRQIKF